MSPRYAVYYTPPPSHPLWHAGCDWLQRDPTAAVARPPSRAHVGQPWRYGFHATLKPPMRLAPGRAEADLRTAISALARRTPRFTMPALSVQPLAGFVALRPAEPLPAAHPLWRLADDCVTELDAWRAPADGAELQRRQAAPLNEAQQALLQRYGYPHVLDGWRFHMTLSDSLGIDHPQWQPLLGAATAFFAEALAQPLACESLSLFVEPATGQPLRLVHRFALA